MLIAVTVTDPWFLRKLIAQSDSKVNSKKKKRLEKYIVSVRVSPYGWSADISDRLFAGEETQTRGARISLRETLVRPPPYILNSG